MLSYAAHELRRRLGRTLLTAFGLAAGVGLVVGIIGVSQGLNEAQLGVLAPLKSIGTDILVTRVAGGTSAAPTPTPGAGGSPGVPAQPSGRGGFFGMGASSSRLNEADADALAKENSNVLTDLSKLGKPGTTFTRDFFLSATLISFPQDALAEVSKIEGVVAASGALTQLASHQTGTVPEIVARLTTGGETVTGVSRPAPMTDRERAAFEKCMGSGRDVDSPPVRRDPGACLPARFREFRFRATTPLRTITQVLDPPQTDIKSTSYTAAGIDPTSPNLGLVTTAQLQQGRWLSASAPNEVLLGTAYANKNSLKVGSKLPINGTDYAVVGIVSPTLAGASADVYFPLATLQKLAGKTGRVTQVLVKVTSAGAVDAVVAQIERILPGAEVVTTKSLADQVTGSLADARKLTDRFGGALAVIVLTAAFVIAVLLTLGSIAKRVREIGTLRAIGWSRRRVVRQILTETIGIGLLGGLIGMGIGVLAALAVGAYSPELTATTSGVPNVSTSNFAGFFGSTLPSTLKTATVTLEPPIHLLTLALGVGFALVGGLIAGTVGGWRASRLSPAEALRSVG